MLTNPILSSTRNLFLYFLFWFIISACYFLMLTLGLKIKLDIAAIDIIFTVLLFGISIFLWYPACYISLEGNNLYKIILNHTLGSLLTTTIWLALGYFIVLSLFPGSNNYITFFNNTLVLRYFIGILFYSLIITFYYTLIYYYNLQERILNEAELKNSITEAELKTLKFQINPHFIFNSLNSMSALTAIDPERARSMILKLADFLRYTLANNEKEKNLLGEELKNIKLYLEIEKIRFEDKFEYIEEVEEECKKVPIPNMILQPLFENAVKHAVYESLNKVTIHLKCHKEKNYFYISIENNFEPGESKSKGAGIGLQNVRRRLELIYNYPNLLEVKKEENKFIVNILIPI